MLEKQQADGGAGLEIEQDLSTQTKIWKFERFGWCVLAVIVAAGVLGLLGDGPLSPATADFETGKQLTYERFLHNDTQSTIEIPIPHGATARHVWFSLSAPYAESIHVDQMNPQPEQTIVTATETRFLFESGKIDSQRAVSLTFTPIGVGRLRGTISSSSGRSVPITQFVYP